MLSQNIVLPSEIRAISRMIKCKLCKVEITDPDFHLVLYQKEFPEILIGPYCEPCYGRIKVCSKCNKAFAFSILDERDCPKCT